MSAPPKVRMLFAVPRFSVGGAEKLLVRMLPAVDRGRFDVSLVTLFDEQKDSCASEAHIDRCFHLRSTWDIVAFIRLVRYVRRGKFDVVVTHLFSANLLVRLAAILAHPVRSFASNGARMPVIIAYEHNIYPNKRRWQIFMDRLLAKWTARIIVDSEAARTFTATQERIPIGKFVVHLIPPLLDDRPRRSPEQLRTELRIPSGEPVILTVSRLVVDKGHTYLVDAAARVLKKYPTAHFLIGGWGPLKEPLEAKARTLGISERVRFLGRVDGQEYLALADIYADPSISTDLPIGIMEAMREGKAIVATGVGEIPSFIRNGETGVLVPHADPEALAHGIFSLLESSSMRERLGAAAKEKVAPYDLGNYVRAFEDLVAGLLPERRCAGPRKEQRTR